MTFSKNGFQLRTQCTEGLFSRHGTTPVTIANNFFYCSQRHLVQNWLVVEISKYFIIGYYSQLIVFSEI